MSLPFKSDAIEVVSGGAANPKFVAGTADPTGGLAAPEGSIFLRYVASNGRAYVKSGPGDTDWSLILAGSGGSTLDAAYDFGGAGAGRIITADSGAVQIDATTSNTQAALHINRQPGVSSASVGISVTLNANVTGPGITVAQGGSGPAIQISSGALEIANSSPSLSPSNTGRIKYNSATQTFQVSMNGSAYADIATGAGMVIGGAITGATAGSVLFAGVGGVLAQDNANLFWDDPNNRLAVGTTTPGYSLDVRNAGASQLHIANGNVDSGGYLTSTVASQLYLSGGLGFDGTNLRAKATTASVIELNTAAISFQTATGLTIGAISAMTERMLLHAAGGLEILNSDSATVSLASRGKIRYTTSGQKFQVSANTGSYFDVGTYATTPLVAGAVLFANSSNQIAQNNSFLTWNDTNRSLGVASNHATSGPLFLQSTVTTGPSGMGVIDSSSNFKSYWGFFNSAYAFTYMRNKSGILSFTGENIIFGNATIATHEFGMTANSLFFEMFNGGSAAVSTANAGRIRYNTTGQKFQISANGGAYVDLAVGSGMSIGGAITSATAGSVLFAGAAGILQQDNANLFWDDSSNELGIGTASPGAKLHVFGQAMANDLGTTQPTFEGGFTAQLTAAQGGGNWGITVVRATADAVAAHLTIAKTRATDPSVKTALINGDQIGDLTFQGVDGASVFLRGATIVAIVSGAVGAGVLPTDLAFTTAATSPPIERMRITSDGGVEFSNSSASAVSAANTGRIRYNTTGQKFQVSANGAAYVDLATASGPVVEYLSADGAADPAADTTYVSGTGTDLTLANGTVGGFIKNFVITGGSGTITPANLADGNVLTWTAAPSNVSFIWDATNTTWHVVGSPYNMVTT